MNKTIIQVGNDETLRWQVSAGDHILWVRWKDIFSSKSDVGILDFWEIREGDAVAITNRIEDLPPWFELCPTEVAGFAACMKMKKKMDGGYRRTESVEGPNLWRVLTGDRLVWIQSSDAGLDRPKQTFVEFKRDALVFGERLLDSDLVWFLSFGAPVEESPSKQVSVQWLAGLDQIRSMGLPREVSSGRWQLGS